MKITSFKQEYRSLNAQYCIQNSNEIYQIDKAFDEKYWSVRQIKFTYKNEFEVTGDSVKICRVKTAKMAKSIIQNNVRLNDFCGTEMPKIDWMLTTQIRIISRVIKQEKQDYNTFLAWLMDNMVAQNKNFGVRLMDFLQTKDYMKLYTALSNCIIVESGFILN
jgi:hypothetical protein